MTLTQIIQQLDNVKRDLIASGLKTQSESVRQRELKAALEIHRIGTRLAKVNEQLDPVQRERLDTEPSPKQLPLLKDEQPKKQTVNDAWTSSKVS